MATNLASALCYLPFIGWIIAIVFLLIEPYNRDREVRFHAWQAIALAVALVALNICLGILHFIVAMVSGGLGLVFAPILMLVYFGEFLLFVFLAFKAYQNQRIVVPVVGPFAQKQA
jgi:uncharacterized membrane protein